MLCNITVIYLPNSPTYCIATLPWETLDVARKVKVTGQKLHVDAQKLMPYRCQEAQASFSSILALRLIADLLSQRRTDAADAVIHSFRLSLIHI